MEAMSTQWNISAMSGQKTGINYNSMKIIEKKTGIKLNKKMFFIFQQLEIKILNMQAEENKDV